MTEGQVLPYIYAAFCSRRFWVCTGLYAFIWLVLTRGELSSWLVGVPAACIAGFLSCFLTPSHSNYPRPFTLFLFAFFFLKQAFLGAVDVLRRAIAVEPVLNPGLVPFSTCLPNGSAQIFFANTISLIPGTLSVDIENDTIIVHTLDVDLPIWSSLQNLEFHIAALFHIEPQRGKNAT